MESPNNFYKGKILIADPFLMGPVFERSVIYLTDHNEEGAMGFIINSPTNITVGQAVSQISHCELPVYYGGPVDENILFYVHTLGDKIPKSVEVGDGIYWGGEFSVVAELINQEVLNENNIKFFVGYSGWGELQLEDEFEKKSWVVGDFQKSYLFKNSQPELWNEVIGKADKKLELFGRFAHSPSLN